VAKIEEDNYASINMFLQVGNICIRTHILYVCVCVYIYIYIYMHTQIHTHIRMYPTTLNKCFEMIKFTSSLRSKNDMMYLLYDEVAVYCDLNIFTEYCLNYLY
jgi:hypothetical protein